MFDALPGAFEAPSLSLLATEPLRAALEYTRMRFMPQPQSTCTDVHPVVVFPGLGTDERFVAPLIEHCRALGYPTYDWGRGLNTGPAGDVDAWLDELAREVDAATVQHRQRMTLIGWSLGGIYAREIAKLLPRRVRQVITIGTPFCGTPEQTNVTLLYRLLNGAPARLAPSLARRLRAPPPMPTMSIYSRSDGVVAWQACVQDDATHVEHVEVDGSHLGLAWNPGVLAAIARRLSTSNRTPDAEVTPARPRSGSRRARGRGWNRAS
jgi:pimeloyl-ACP methyl ester carboxylesterase